MYVHRNIYFKTMKWNASVTARLLQRESLQGTLYAWDSKLTTNVLLAVNYSVIAQVEGLTSSSFFLSLISWVSFGRTWLYILCMFAGNLLQRSVEVTSAWQLPQSARDMLWRGFPIRKQRTTDSFLKCRMLDDLHHSALGTAGTLIQN